MNITISMLKSMNSNFSESELAILATICYFDIFDYPLTAPEIHQNLVRTALPIDSILIALKNEPLRSILVHKNGYYVLAGREEIINIRNSRFEFSQRHLWPLAIRYGWYIANLPYVRMVGVTGSLSMNNTFKYSDIDFFIVAKAKRVWVCRLLVFLLQKASVLNGTVLCPNYIISEENLAISEQDLFTAYQLTHIIPITNTAMYKRILRSNNWIYKFLPNTRNGRKARLPFQTNHPLKTLAELALNNPIGIWLDLGERARVLKKYGNIESSSKETSFLPDRYKGHFSGHAKRTEGLFLKRLEEILI
ncbi:MAG: hypothetical protein ACFFE8_04395 [Candidatus Heimdallarchaeota archaeon]